MIRHNLITTLLTTAILAAAPLARAADKLPQTDTEKKALDYLLSKQGPDGAWIPQPGPAITAMAVKGLLHGGHHIDEPAIRKALAYIKSTRQLDGGFYIDSNATYNTSITLTTLASLPDDARADWSDAIKGAQGFLIAIQSGAEGAQTDDKGKLVTPEHPWYGGWGYGQGTKVKPGRRPDLSNTQFVIEALRTSGIPASDDSIKNALIFLTRTQASDQNDLAWAKAQPHDGGFIYGMGFNAQHDFYGQSEGPDSKDRDGNDILTTYGSMTYAGLRSLIFADLKKDDPRVQAAMRWIRGSYTLDVNPGLNNAQGLYYYYHTFAACLDAYGEDTLTDAKGTKHNWRDEFNTKMTALQKPDGSYINAASRFMESNPVLVTSYVVLSLQSARGIK
ncbi:MAG TPA: prenyltransferase/squalene oxidase repeat-containing protein [Phycisphaerae bacterium]|nr:prenyltransferase/squalene oxidase repeat-containing protein [Phycisphaerae bacterium]